MKKLSFVFALLCATVFSFAQKTLVLDFTPEDVSGLPTSTALAQDYTFNGVTLTLANAKWTAPGSYNKNGFLMLYNNTKEQKIAGSITLPAVDFKIGSISVLTGESASTAVKVSLLAGDKEIETKTLSEKNAEFAWTVTGDVIGTRYTLAVANDKNAQFQKIVITEAAAGGTLSFKDNKDIQFGIGLNDNQEQEVEVLADGLASDISVSIIGTGFTTETTTLPAAGGKLTVSYTAATAGTAEGTITLTSGTVTATAKLVAITAEHAGTKEDPLTLADVATLCDKAGKAYWVIGKIAGCAANDGKLADKTTASNIALGETEPYVPVQLPSQSDIRTNLNLVDNPQLLNTTVKIQGLLQTYFTSHGIKSPTEYELVGPTTGIENIEAAELDLNAPMYNVLGQQVNKEYKGIVIQNGQKFFLR